MTISGLFGDLGGLVLFTPAYLFLSWVYLNEWHEEMGLPNRLLALVGLAIALSLYCRIVYLAWLLAWVYGLPAVVLAAQVTLLGVLLVLYLWPRWCGVCGNRVRTRRPLTVGHYCPFCGCLRGGSVTMRRPAKHLLVVTDGWKLAYHRRKGTYVLRFSPYGMFDPDCCRYNGYSRQDMYVKACQARLQGQEVPPAVFQALRPQQRRGM